MRFLQALCVVFALGVSGVAAAGDYSEIYSDAKRLEPFKNSQYIHASMNVVAKDPGALDGLDLIFVIHAKTGDVHVPVAKDGSFDWPLSDALREENPQVELLPKDRPKVGIGFNIEVSAKPEIDFPLATYTAMRDEYVAARDQQSLMVRMFLPKSQGLLITFSEGACGTATLPEQTSALSADAKCQLKISDDKLKNASGGRVHFAPAPKKIELDLN